MYVQRLKVSSGKVYIQVIGKSFGKYKVIKSFGGTFDQKDIVEMENEARSWIDKTKGILRLNFTNEGYGMD